MALSIGTNTSAMAAQRSLISSQSNLQTSFERLSSGNRINSAADDAAGLSIASRLQAQAAGLATAQRNAANGVSLVETADAALGSVEDLLIRARDLLLQKTDGTLNSTDTGNIDLELTAIDDQLDKIGLTKFAGEGLFTGSFSKNVAVGPDGATTAVAITYDVASVTVSGSSATAIDTALNTLNTARAGLGAHANTFQTAIENLAAVEQGVTAAAGRILDTDYARETGELAKNQILQQAGTAILAQANQTTQSVMSLLQ